MVVNNVGFLILPWIRVKDLASRLLAENIRVLADDWYQFYAYPFVLAETFVDGRFPGTCYKASNWMHAGDTKGRGKYDRYNQCSGSVKAVFLYPLQKNFREVLRMKIRHPVSSYPVFFISAAARQARLAPMKWFAGFLKAVRLYKMASCVPCSRAFPGCLRFFRVWQGLEKFFAVTLPCRYIYVPKIIFRAP